MAERPSARAPGGAAGRSLMPSLTTKEPANRVVKYRFRASGLDSLGANDPNTAASVVQFASLTLAASEVKRQHAHSDWDTSCLDETGSLGWGFVWWVAQSGSGQGLTFDLAFDI
ncbi:uncharacterized protein E0L32_004527 [Thyridium curvatum]|uniref:Uncharacterized protein n=1 Tax=Thyridium curvatum TaxID=1093900 RepID=A0A507BFC7_9PEZI|nr:uncharacterized protein E0L32_004527 [Thyridium curvatum]TPX15250.1 hypothetical protein E0L32_004527 [Thyridium curvatum]